MTTPKHKILANEGKLNRAAKRLDAAWDVKNQDS